MSVVVEKAAGIDKAFRSLFVRHRHFVVVVARRTRRDVFGTVADDAVEHHEPTLFGFRSRFDGGNALVVACLDEFGNVTSRTAKEVDEVGAETSLHKADHHHVREATRQHTVKGVRTG